MDQIVKRAIDGCIKIIIANGIDEETNIHVLELAEKYPIIKPSLGLYPVGALENEPDRNIDREIRYIKENKDKITAIGEVGLDFKDSDEKPLQIKTFEKIIRLALETDKPMIVHSRKAEKDAIEILEKFKAEKVVMHCFSGKLKLAQRIINNGWYFSIPANIVRSEHMQKLAGLAPLKQILTETDSPFLSPFRDLPNEPAYIIEGVKKIAEIKNLEIERTAEIIYSNYKNLFEKRKKINFFPG